MFKLHFSPGLWYKIYYTDGSTEVARCLTTPYGEIKFLVKDKGEVSRDIMLRNCINAEPIDEPY